MPQIEHRAAFVGVEIEEYPTVLGVDNMIEKRTTLAVHVTARRLDFDYVGTDVSQELGRNRGRDALAVFDYPDAGKRAGIGGGAGIEFGCFYWCRHLKSRHAALAGAVHFQSQW